MHTIASDFLAAVHAGTTTPPSNPPVPPRTWGQVAADYTAACVQNATTAAIFQGRPATWQQLAVTAGVGCAMGVASRAAQDWAARR